MIVDAHAHIFSELHGRIGAGEVIGRGYGRAIVGHEELQILPPFCERTSFTSEALIAHIDWAGVDKAVLLQGPFYGECNRYVLEAVKRYPDRLIGAAYFDPWSPDNHEMFEIICASVGFRAVKLECSEATGLCGIHPDARLDAPDIAWVWDELEQRRLVLVIDLGAVSSRSYQTRALRVIAEEHQELKIVIAHLAQPTPRAESDPELWRLCQGQIDLGRLPNVWFDSASLPAYFADEGYPYPSVERFLRMAIDCVGPTKVMWGSDLPGLLVHANYPQLVKLARSHIQFLSSMEQAMVLGENAMRVYSD